MAEAVRFELTEPFGSLVFKTSALNHSATLPMPAGGELRRLYRQDRGGVNMCAARIPALIFAMSARGFGPGTNLSGSTFLFQSEGVHS